MSVGEVCYPSPKNNDFVMNTNSDLSVLIPEGEQLKSDGLAYCQNASNR